MEQKTSQSAIDKGRVLGTAAQISAIVVGLIGLAQLIRLILQTII